MAASACGVHSGVGPSSIVRAMSLADGAARNVTAAAYAPRPDGAAVRAVGPSAVPPAPVAKTAPDPAAPPAASKPAPATNLRRSMRRLTRFGLAPVGDRFPGPRPARRLPAFQYHPRVPARAIPP